MEHAIHSVKGNTLIFRTTWVTSLRRDNFVTKVLGWARKKETLRVVDNQVSNLTWGAHAGESDCTGSYPWKWHPAGADRLFPPRLRLRFFLALYRRKFAQAFDLHLPVWDAALELTLE